MSRTPAAARGEGHPYLTVEFCGEEYVIASDAGFSIGRSADLTVDADNSYLHRRLVQLGWENGFWWVSNVGSRLSVTVSGDVGGLQSTLSPGATLPLVLPSSTLLFTAGPTTYEVNLTLETSMFTPAPQFAADDGDITLGVVPLTDSQFQLLLALCENALRRAGSGAASIPTNVAVARRLGWSITTFNRKLDNVCEKFDRAGVSGLRGGPGRNAVGRRSRLVEYALASQIVRREHLPLLETSSGEEK